MLCYNALESELGGQSARCPKPPDWVRACASCSVANDWDRRCLHWWRPQHALSRLACILTLVVLPFCMRQLRKCAVPTISSRLFFRVWFSPGAIEVGLCQCYIDWPANLLDRLHPLSTLQLGQSLVFVARLTSLLLPDGFELPSVLSLNWRTGGYCHATLCPTLHAWGAHRYLSMIVWTALLSADMIAVFESTSVVQPSVASCRVAEMVDPPVRTSPSNKQLAPPRREARAATVYTLHS